MRLTLQIERSATPAPRQRGSFRWRQRSLCDLLEPAAVSTRALACRNAAGWVDGSQRAEASQRFADVVHRLERRIG